MGTYYFKYRGDTYTVTVKVTDSEEKEPRFTVVMTSDAFPEPEDVFAIWDNTIRNYHVSEDGSVQTFSDESAAQQYLNRLTETVQSWFPGH